MKRLFPIFALLLAGCAHTYVVALHKPKTMADSPDKLPIKIGLYLPPVLIKENIPVDYEWEFFNSRNYALQYDSVLVRGISQAVKASVQEIAAIDSFPNPNVVSNESLKFVIVPKVKSTRAKIWRNSYGFSRQLCCATFESQIQLNFCNVEGKTFDSVDLYTVGLSEKIIINLTTPDSVVVYAADSAISRLQDQIVNAITKNTSIRKLLSLPEATSTAIQLDNPMGRYGSETPFNYDTITHQLTPIPDERRWAMFEEIGMSSSPAISAGIDLLLHSSISFRLGAGFGNPYSNYNTNFDFRDLNISARSSYLFFGPSHFLELGFKVTAFLNKNFSGAADPMQKRIHISSVIGYRHQPMWNKIFVGISYESDGTDFSPYLYEGRRFNHSFTFSLGLSF